MMQALKKKKKNQQFERPIGKPGPARKICQQDTKDWDKLKIIIIR